MGEAQSGRVRWQIGPGWPTYPCKSSHRSVQGVIPPTQSFATSTTTASPNPVTSARVAEGTGLGAARYETSPSAGAAEETRGLKEEAAVEGPPNRRQAQLALQIAAPLLMWQASAPPCRRP